MPHSSKKYRKPESKSSSLRKRNNLYITIGIVAIIAIVAGSGGWYVYSSMRNTATGLQSGSSVTNTTGETSLNSSQLSSLLSGSGAPVGTEFAIVNTSQGYFVIQLFQNETPTAVNNFVSLADSGFYTNLVWHRIATGFVIQTGDPNTKNAQGNPCSWGTGTSGRTIPLEVVPSLHNYAGYVAYASPSGGLASSQWFVNLGDNSQSLDGKYTVFGKVVSGMNVVTLLGNLQVSSACGSSTDGPPANPQQAMLYSVQIRVYS